MYQSGVSESGTPRFSHTVAATQAQQEYVDNLGNLKNKIFLFLAKNMT